MSKYRVNVDKLHYFNDSHFRIFSLDSKRYFKEYLAQRSIILLAI